MGSYTGFDIVPQKSWWTNTIGKNSCNPSKSVTKMMLKSK